MIFDPLNHSEYSEIDKSCLCAVCANWRASLDAYLDAQNCTGLKEGRPKRGSEMRSERDVKAMMSRRSVYMAAVNRREVYCEISWHAVRMSNGADIMSWLKEQLAARSDNWWEISAPQMTIGEWMAAYYRARGLGIGAENALVI